MCTCCAWILHGLCVDFCVGVALMLRGFVMDFAWILYFVCMLHGFCMYFAWILCFACILHGCFVDVAWILYCALILHGFRRDVVFCVYFNFGEFIRLSPKLVSIHTKLQVISRKAGSPNVWQLCRGR